MRLQVTGGARVFAADETEPWMILGATVWPARGPDSWGISIRGAFTTGASFATDSLSGVLREVALSAALHRWIRLGDAVALVPFAGASAHASRLDATVAGASAPVSIVRVNPSLDLGIALPIRLVGPLDVGPYVASSFSLRYQRYLVGGAVALESWPISLEFGAQATTTVF